jgi:alkanesulfonate monooxygenase SsuD/methylene tetrahydromethanopterin reductase-like flavin-dependent oxidoreductase (luciferase family)
MRFSYQIGMCEPDHYLPLAKAAEQAGYHGITIPDSICYPKEASSKYPYNKDGSREFLERVPFIESLIAVAAMAAVTQKIRFATFVYKRCATGADCSQAGTRHSGAVGKSF